MSFPEKDFDLVIVGNCGNAELVPRKENSDIQAPRIPLFTVSFRSTFKAMLGDLGMILAKGKLCSV